MFKYIINNDEGDENIKNQLVKIMNDFYKI